MRNAASQQSLKSFKVPFALGADGKLCSPEDAQKGSVYRCPSCGEQVVFRSGSVRAKHFAHKASTGCAPETVEHKTAKLLVQEAVRDWKAGRAPAPVLRRRCPICYEVADWILPERIEQAVLERPLDGGFVADVALLTGGRVEAVVEIKMTHAIGEAKAGLLEVPFVELNALDVMRSPRIWNPVTDQFGPFVCTGCCEARERFQVKAERLARQLGIKLPKAYYRYGIYRCWKCKREILVFTWPEHRSFSRHRPKVDPIPQALQYRFSGTMGMKYWVNVCLRCGAIQGDHFLYSDFDGPFFGLYRGEEELGDTPEAFEADLMRIAAHAAELRLI